ncbi:RsmF rRNA methyltransferase first C-terminal domain-containing protein [uncultured Limosilactobacillus sp.]|uniref:RsmB/NOP family class I SAM-dependent RNA methyltransferase n=1 Tax=uncultured Limosilactobacillus sp. TaxID=2837629 RepID=UPI0025DE20C9|nr:RsmF rRNA methyltransferase first C-terminal domain-containing protein [uncultured Limosilactobacillus sp.]
MNLPAAFIEKYQRLMGERESAAFIKALTDKSAVSGFRVNPGKPGLPEETISKTGNQAVPGVNNGYYGQVDGKSLDHVTGWVYSQEPSAMNVAVALDPQPGEKVLDLCAAPGGKSTQIVALMHNEGLLVANEIFAKRAKVLAENLERWGAVNAVVTNESPAELETQFPRFFDRILVDAPCSGEGMFRKDPAGIQYWNPDYPTECANRQRQILKSALKMLKPGGTLVYSTCTFAPEEDEQNAAWLLNHYDLTICPIAKAPGMDHGQPEWADGNPELAKAIRLFPHHYHGEGHFIAKFTLTTEMSEMSQSQVHRKKAKNKRRQRRGDWTPSRQELGEWQQWSQAVMPSFAVSHFLKFGDQLYACPSSMKPLAGFHVLRPGLHLGTLKKKRFEPSLALAMALAAKDLPAVRCLSISKGQWRKYVHGETLTVGAGHENGWYLLVANGHPCGFGKLVGTTVKNFYPKGLRF